MRIAHVALWTRDLDRLRDFYTRHLGAEANARYESRNTPGLRTHFLTFPGGGCRLELMALPALADAAAPPAVGWAHVALAVGDEAEVDALTARLAAAGVPVLSPPRRTGDGYYESVVADPDGNRIELTAG
ncbi:VOC family protein [Roseisolibacter sp. H3M3-2]|uniref:VOC family protein n=1 Tax=Roseisolibacter sp. H3M3-2 TaxID=3031323 RepID=UPI0023DBC683|nr:VOC family protein [Roseisolibacter sp. H3M3-2]MDF1502482.1 VOC family protein [Roseisolibacter sp. H3M3-2]